MLSIIPLVIIIFLSSLLQGVTGFGFAVVAAPLLLYVKSQQDTVALFNIVSLFLNGYLLTKINSKISFGTLANILLPALPGIFLGAYLLTNLDSNFLLRFTGFMCSIFVLLLLIKPKKIKRRRWLERIIGLLVGFLHSSIGVNGPPLVLLLLAYRVDKTNIRKNLAFIFFTLSIIAIPLLVRNGIINTSNVSVPVTTIPFVLMGAYIGDKISKKMPIRLFRFITLIIVLISSLGLVLKTI